MYLQEPNDHKTVTRVTLDSGDVFDVLWTEDEEGNQQSTFTTCPWGSKTGNVADQNAGFRFRESAGPGTPMLARDDDADLYVEGPLHRIVAVQRDLSR